MEPVEIDFIIGGNTEAEGEKVEQTFDQITAAAKKAQADAQKAIQEQKSIIKSIESDIKSIEKEISKAAPGNAQSEMIKDLNAAKMALQEEKAALNDVSVSVEKTAKKHTMLRTTIMNLKDELAQMEMAGKRGTPEYTKMATELGRLNDQMGDTNTQAKILADDQKGFRAVGSAVTGLTGAMTAAVGAASLFGAENEELTRIQTRLQAVMAISIGIQQVSETLNKDSYFSVVILTRAKQMWAATELKLAASIGVSTAAARAGMIALTGGLIIAVIAAVAVIDHFISKQTESTKKAKEFGDKVGESASKPLASIQSLSSKWSELGTNLKDKKKFVDDNKKAFEELGVQVNNVADAENLLITNKDAFIESLVLKARAAAGMELAAESYKKAISKMNEAEGMSKTTDIYTNTGGQGISGGGTISKTTVKNSARTKLEEEVKALYADGDKFIKESNAQSLKADEVLAAAKILKIKENKTKQTKEQYNASKEIQALILDINSQTNKLLLDQQADSLQKRLAQIETEKNEEIRKITDKETSIIEAYNKSHKDEKGFTPVSSLAAIDPAKAAELATAKDNVTAAFGKKVVEETKLYGDKVTALAMDYAEERVQIQYDYNLKIKELAQEGLIVQAAALAKERDKRISDVSKGLIEETELYKLASADQLNISKYLTEKLIAEIKKRIAADKTLTAEDATKLLEEINKAELTVQKTNNPFTDLIDGVEKYKKAREEQSRYNTETDLANFIKLEEAANEAKKATLQAAAGALNGISTIIADVTSQIKGLTDLEKEMINEVQNLLSGAATLAQGIATDNPIAIVQGSIQVLTNLYSLLDTQAREVEARLESNKAAVDSLNIAYKNLGDEISKAYGTDKAKLIQDQIDLLNKEKQIIEDSKQAELSKSANKTKHQWWEYAIPGWNTYSALDTLLSPKTDDKAVQEFNDRLAEIELEKAQLAQDAMVEAITGTPVMSAIDDFANAYADAFTSGEDAALKSAEIVKNILKTALIEKLKNDLKPGITALMNMVSSAMEDGFLSEQEKADIYAQNDKNNAKAAEEQKFFNDLGLNDTSAKGIQGDVNKMTEETGSALVGQISAMRLNVAALLVNSKSSVDVMSKQLATLEAIRTNTQRLDRIDETLYYIKQNGITVK